MKRTALIIGVIICVGLLSAFRTGYVRFDEGLVEVDPCLNYNDTYLAGEKLVYSVYYKAGFIWVKAGEVVFTVEDQEDSYKMIAKGYTLPFYDKFYKVRDHYETHIDKKTLNPTLFIRDIQEGDYSMYDKIVFDQKGKTAETTRKHRGETKHLEGTFEVCVQDMLSILYHMRNIKIDEFDVGDKIPVNVYHENRTYDLKIHYSSYNPKKRLKGTGKVKAFELRPDLIKNYIISDDHNMSIWVSDDQNKLPLEIEAKLTVGKMKAILSDYQGLRYEARYETVFRD